MSVPPAARLSPARRSLFRGIILSVVALTIALLFFRLPLPPEVDARSASRVLLDLSFRPDSGEPRILPTLNGPLAPLHDPIYTGRSIWRSIVWQFGANFLMAVIVVMSASKLGGARVYWAIALVLVFGLGDPMVVPWLTILLLGNLALRSVHRGWRACYGIGLGILASLSIAHLLLGLGALVFQIFRRTEHTDRGAYATAGFFAGLGGTWLVLGQSLDKLARWVWFGLTAGWTPSALSLNPQHRAVVLWAAVAVIAWLALIVREAWPQRRHGMERSTTWLVLWAMGVSWKLVSLQPGKNSLIFFATTTLAGFVLLPHARWRAGVIVGIGILGTMAVDPMLIGDAAGRINRAGLENFREIRQLPELRSRLRRDFSGFGTAFSMPRTRAITGNSPVGFLDHEAAQVVLNDFRLPASPRFGENGIPHASTAKRDADALRAAEAPPFLLQRIDEMSELAPGMRSGPTQLALYRAYEFVLAERGLSLWKKRPGPTRETFELIRAGTVRAGERIDLPAGDDAYWLEIECSPNLLGWLRDQISPLPEPALRLGDSDRRQLRYALGWRAARTGFLVRPFFRGDTDLLRFQEGQPLPRVDFVVIDPPDTTQWAWKSTIGYRLYRLAPLGSIGAAKLSAPLMEQFSTFPRLPLAVTARFPAVFGLVEEKSSVFMHPESVVEIALDPGDRILEGSFGISAAAYAGTGPDVTDGVSFQIEFIPANGPRQKLLERHLDPAGNSDDRGSLAFSLSLPASTGGRLLFRTFNLPHASRAFDWAYWREITLK